MGEVAGRPEQDEDRRVRDALEAEAFAQDVLHGLRARRRLPCRASRSSFIVSGSSFGRGAGWAGIGWSAGASSGAGPCLVVARSASAAGSRPSVATRS